MNQDVDGREKFSPSKPMEKLNLRNNERNPERRAAAVWLPVAVVYGLIEGALWTPAGHWNTFFVLAAMVAIVLFTEISPFSAEDMGLTVPTAGGSGRIVLGAAILAAMVPLLSMTLGDYHAPAHVLPLGQACMYAVWALVQEFILQSFFYVRLESLLGARWAVLTAALLFGAAHVPNYVLAVTSLVAGLFFCEMFRRYRNLWPLGVVHAVLGLTIAARFPDAWLHHMRVGIGYLRFHL